MILTCFQFYFLHACYHIIMGRKSIFILCICFVFFSLISFDRTWGGKTRRNNEKWIDGCPTCDIIRMVMSCVVFCPFCWWWTFVVLFSVFNLHSLFVFSFFFRLYGLVGHGFFPWNVDLWFFSSLVFCQFISLEGCTIFYNWYWWYLIFMFKYHIMNA